MGSVCLGMTLHEAGEDKGLAFFAEAKLSLSMEERWKEMYTCLS